jgi:hypothetical protein
MDIILIAMALIVIFILFSGMKPSGGGSAAGDTSSKPTIQTTSNTASGLVSERDAQNYAMLQEIAKGNLVVNEKGLILADSIYKDRARISGAAQVSNILTREGANTTYYQNINNNPLEVAYTVGYSITGPLPAGIRANEMNLTQTYVSARPPANELERRQAQLSNAKAIGSSAETIAKIQAQVAAAGG